MNERQDTKPVERLETKEARLPAVELLDLWMKVAPNTQATIETAQSADDIVDIVRTSNLRAGTAVTSGWDSWRDIWYSIKYLALVRAIEMRAEGNRDIKVNVDENRDGTGVDYLLFSFNVGNKPYATETFLKNIEMIVTGERLEELLGEYDDVQPTVPYNKHKWNR